MSDVLDHVVESISPASAAQAMGAGQRLAGLGAELGTVGDWAKRLAAARHSPRPSLSDKVVVIVAADHGLADPGVDLGHENPTLTALEELAMGAAALNTAARGASATLILVDAGIRGAADFDLGEGILRFRLGNGTGAIHKESAMTIATAVQALQTGIALVYSLADTGLDILALGNIGAGNLPSSAALVGALANASPDDVCVPEDRDLVTQAFALHEPAALRPIETLASVGGFDHGLLAGMILGAASIHVPVVLDGHATSAAALVAHAIRAECQGYLFASHGGDNLAHKLALRTLGLEPLYGQAIGQGEGTGAVLALPMLDTAATTLLSAG